MGGVKLVRQEEGSNLCGQACVAMLAGVDLERAKELLGQGRTTTADLRAALGLFGVRLSIVGHRISARRPTLPASKTGLLRALGPEKRDCHWLVWHDGQIYDPTAGVFGQEDWMGSLPEWRLTSYWPVTRIIR